MNASHCLDPIQVFGDAGESVRNARLATQARDEAGNADSDVLAGGLLVVQGTARVSLKKVSFNLESTKIIFHIKCFFLQYGLAHRFLTGGP